MKNLLRIFCLGLLLLALPPAVAAAVDPDSAADENNDDKGIKLSASQMELAGIRVQDLIAQPMEYLVYAPGEVLANGYSSFLVSARVPSVVVQRTAGLGDLVTRGQPLVTLFSDAVAEAQAAYRVAEAEYIRVKKLGKKSVGEKRFIQAKNDFEMSYGRLRAYGLSEDAVKATGSKNVEIGKYSLVAEVDGAILSDNFRQGQRVEAGDALMEIASEQELWVEARLAPDAKINIPAGTPATVKVAGESFPAKVIQKAHTIDEVTRTRIVRLSVQNTEHKLHPGQFADVLFRFTTADPVLSVPETALIRGADGDWVVFVEEEPGYFIPHEVEVGRTLGTFREIKGVSDGLPVVMEGAFFVASEAAKTGFDPHGH